MSSNFDLALSVQFYSWYMYPEKEEDFGKSVSSAEYIEDVDNDSVVIIDGLTKVSIYYMSGLLFLTFYL